MRRILLAGVALAFGVAVAADGLVRAQDEGKARNEAAVRLVEHIGLMDGPRDYATRRMRYSGMDDAAIAKNLASPRWAKVRDFLAADLARFLEPADLAAAVELFDGMSPEQRAAYRASRTALQPVRGQLLWLRQRADCFMSSWESFPESVARRDGLRAAIDGALEGTPAAGRAR